MRYLNLPEIQSYTKMPSWWHVRGLRNICLFAVASCWDLAVILPFHLVWRQVGKYLDEMLLLTENWRHLTFPASPTPSHALLPSLVIVMLDEDNIDILLPMPDKAKDKDK